MKCYWITANRSTQSPAMRARQAFTLIELLIVVAIIAILAAIAVPNFLEAQTRAKVSRVKTDFRTLSTALEAYCVDNAAYPWPNEGNVEANVKLAPLTTPVAYISAGVFQDPFLQSAVFTQQGSANPNRSSVYQYANYKYWHAVESNRWNGWALMSMGPARLRYGIVNLIALATSGAANRMANLCNAMYDPTNGTVSAGNIVRIGGAAPSHIYAVTSTR
ncbi:MAG: Type II secretion system protein G precursor [candidate division BRC1 bacterium ADurb.BinA364]|nr:MAG: Type II secretion system protein G precursor [candidate division BRC1 bacterium ADurb.BinA364]